jgi:hypothetical protein
MSASSPFITSRFRTKGWKFDPNFTPRRHRLGQSADPRKDLPAGASQLAGLREFMRRGQPGCVLDAGQ